MGTFNELLKHKPNAKDVDIKRKELIKKIQNETGRKLLIYAANTDFKGPDQRDIMITREDRTAFIDLIESIKEGSDVDILIESSGGHIETAEDFVTMLRSRFSGVRFIVPNIAKSAGTAMVMSGDEILMDHRSTLGPIDAQIPFKGRMFAAQAFLEGLNKIISEAESKKRLDRAYIPILQGISPAEIQACEDADVLSKSLVAAWLSEYMFSGLEPDMAKQKAESIAKNLCDHKLWLSHGRSIRLHDLQKWDMSVIDYSQYNKLSKYLWDLWIHIFWTFRSNTIKIFESEKINIFKHFQQPTGAGKKPIPPEIKGADSFLLVDKCPQCSNEKKFFLKFKEVPPPEKDAIPYPKNDKHKCDICGANIDLTSWRLDMEKMTGQKALLT